MHPHYPLRILARQSERFKDPNSLASGYTVSRPKSASSNHSNQVAITKTWDLILLDIQIPHLSNHSNQMGHPKTWPAPASKPPSFISALTCSKSSSESLPIIRWIRNVWLCQHGKFNFVEALAWHCMYEETPSLCINHIHPQSLNSDKQFESAPKVHPTDRPTNPSLATPHHQSAQLSSAQAYGTSPSPS